MQLVSRNGDHLNFMSICGQWHPCMMFGRGCSQIMGFILIFGICVYTTGTTGKDNMSTRLIVWSRKELLSLLGDHKLRVSVRCMCLISA